MAGLLKRPSILLAKKTLLNLEEADRTDRDSDICAAPLKEALVSPNAAKRKERIVCDGHFWIKRRIRSGAFGEVFLGTSTTKNKEHDYVAIKREPKDAEDPQLIRENKIYTILKGTPGFPHVHWFGSEGSYTYLVMDFLGPSLEDLFNFCGQKFSIKTVLMIAVQLISRMEALHTRDLVHCDIKPDNFLIGIKDPTLIHVIDFGLSIRYRNTVTKEHIPCGTNKPMIGTARYASLNAHHGLELSRRDDLESIGYLLVYFIKGSLPWQSNPNEEPLSLEEIFAIKENTPVSLLCDKLPPVFAHYITACRQTEFEAKPFYSSFIKQFQETFIDMGYKHDGLYDWITKKALQSLVPELAAMPKISRTSSLNLSLESQDIDSTALRSFRRVTVTGSALLSPTNASPPRSPNKSPKSPYSKVITPRENVSSKAAFSFLTAQTSSSSSLLAQPTTIGSYFSKASLLDIKSADLSSISEDNDDAIQTNLFSKSEISPRIEIPSTVISPPIIKPSTIDYVAPTISPDELDKLLGKTNPSSSFTSFSAVVSNTVPNDDIFVRRNSEPNDLLSSLSAMLSTPLQSNTISAVESTPTALFNSGFTSESCAALVSSSLIEPLSKLESGASSEKLANISELIMPLDNSATFTFSF